jgi:pilus assembly protein CpaB
MNRGIRTLLVVAVAVTVATLATVAVYRAVQRIPVREVELAGVPVVVAARDLPIGTMLTAADLTVANWPARHPLAGGFASPEELVNRGLVADMVANEPVIQAKLAPADSGSGLPPTIPEGMRAISVQVNEVIGVAGFVTPGNHVDVVATISRQDNSMSRVVVSNVRVLAAGTKLDQQQRLLNTGGSNQTTVVTLLVTPSDGERIALASVEGRLHLTLRNPLDVEPTTTAGVRVAGLLGPAEPPVAAKVVRTPPVRTARPPPPPEPVVAKIYTVEAIRAAKRTEEVVK